jgi:hypothetical protein
MKIQQYHLMLAQFFLQRYFDRFSVNLELKRIYLSLINLTMINGPVKTLKCSYKLILNFSKECFMSKNAFKFF